MSKVQIEVTQCDTKGCLNSADTLAQCTVCGQDICEEHRMPFGIGLLHKGDSMGSHVSGYFCSKCGKSFIRYLRAGKACFLSEDIKLALQKHIK